MGKRKLILNIKRRNKILKSLRKLSTNLNEISRYFVICLSRNVRFDRFDGVNRWWWAVQRRRVVRNHTNDEIDRSWASGQIRLGCSGCRPWNPWAIYLRAGNYRPRWYQRLTSRVRITTHPPLHRRKLSGNTQFFSQSAWITLTVFDQIILYETFDKSVSVDSW